jgi:hypothetical protein
VKVNDEFTTHNNRVLGIIGFLRSFARHRVLHVNGSRRVLIWEPKSQPISDLVFKVPPHPTPATAEDVAAGNKRDIIRRYRHKHTAAQEQLNISGRVK